MRALEPVLLAMALLVFPARTARMRLGVENGPVRADSSRARSSRWWQPLFLAASAGLLGALVFGLLPGAALGAGVFWWAGRVQWPVESTDPLELAACWDLLAAGMRAGLPLLVTVRAVAAELTGPSGSVLREVAGLLELGADPASAWEPALRNPGTAELARAARRTARTGSALAEVAAESAAEARKAASDRAQAQAERASVWITAPLGLCFLPAFLCLGVVPVVAGMVQRLGSGW